MIYEQIITASQALSSASLALPLSPEEWDRTLAERRVQWREMLGLHPLPERTPMHVTVTGTLDRGDYVVEKLHFQPSPDAYVAGNLYRPAEISGPLPAVLYLCGHSKGKVNPPYQANPRWFGRHGYVALVLDPIQLGECQGFHGGTIFKHWFHWYSRGYTPAGVEVWNAMRALDYLESREDVDAERMGVTGLSGGGAMSWFLAAADERIRCAAPVCQTGTMEQHARDRTVDGHCDCAFWINLHRWDTPQLGALIAPRALLIAAGSEDEIWRPFAYREVARRIRAQYAALGAPERFDMVEDASPHGYTPKLRNAVFNWFNRWLKPDAAPVADDVTDFVEPADNLLAFNGRLPERDRMKTVDRWFIPVAKTAVPEDAAAVRTWRRERLASLRRKTFSTTVPTAAQLLEIRQAGTNGRGQIAETWVFRTDDGLQLRAHLVRALSGTPGSRPLLVLPQDPRAERIFFCASPLGNVMDSLTVDVRDTGATAMGPGMAFTARRLYMNLGWTLPERQVHDLLSALDLVLAERGYPGVAVYGNGWTAPHAVYAALLNERIREIVLEAPPSTHDDPDSPEFLAVLQTGDLPENLALAWPRAVTFIGRVPDAFAIVDAVYRKLGDAARVRRLPDRAAFRPFAGGQRSPAPSEAS